MKTGILIHSRWRHHRHRLCELGTGDMSTYSLADGSQVLSTPFNVSEDGIILVRSVLDYEAKDVYEF